MSNFTYVRKSLNYKSSFSAFLYQAKVSKTTEQHREFFVSTIKNCKELLVVHRQLERSRFLK
jgi:hypothetical protein